MTRRAPRWTLIGTAALTTATSIWGFAPAPASHADTVIGPASVQLSPAGAGTRFRDHTTSTGSVATLWGNGTMTTPIVAAGATRVSIRVRADQCKGAPRLAVRLGSISIGTMDITSTAWRTYGADVTLSAGTHTLALDFINDYQDAGRCDRNVYLESVRVAPISAPPTTTTPVAPPVTTPPVTPPVTTRPTTPPVTTPPTTPPVTPPVTTPPTTPPAPEPGQPCPVNQFSARYFNNATTTGAAVVSQCENAPGGSFTGRPHPSVNADNFSVEYTGTIEFPRTAEYNISAMLGNVGARVWLDGALVIDQWGPQTWGTTTVPRAVTQGRHQVRAIYYNTGGIAHFGLSMPRSGQGPASNNGNYFAADSFWNQPIPAGSTVDPRSAAWIAELDRTNNGVSLNSSTWTTTVYNAAPGTPSTDILITNTNRRLSIPYRPEYRPTSDGDAHLAVIDDATGCLYEFQGFNPTTRSAIASASYHAYTGSGGHTAGPAHSGGELSYLAGMITPQDVEAGVIDHALRYAMPGNAPTYVYPGTRSDGGTLGGVPEGTRLQLDPAVDLSRFGLTPFQLMVARALQVYGGFNADQSHSFTLYARSTQDGTRYSQPVSGLPDALIAHMRFLTPTMSSTQIQLDRADDMSCSQQR